MEEPSMLEGNRHGDAELTTAEKGMVNESSIIQNISMPEKYTPLNERKETDPDQRSRVKVAISAQGNTTITRSASSTPLNSNQRAYKSKQKAVK